MADKLKFNAVTGKMDIAPQQDVSTSDAPSFAGLTLTSAATITNAATSGTPGNSSKILSGDPNTTALTLKGNLYTPGVVQPNTISGLALWLKADSITGKNDGDKISTWPDSSTNATDAAQATSANQPKYKTNILNGKPAILFDGLQTFMAGTLTGVTNAVSVFAVVKLTDTQNAGIWDCSDNSSTNRSFLFFRQSALMKLRADGAGEAQVDYASFATAYVWSGTSNASTRSVWQNGGSVNTANSAQTVQTPIAYQVGSLFGPTLFTFGYIAEVLVYNVVLSTGDRQKVEAYLGSKYNIVVSTATDQTSNLQIWQNSSGNQLSAIDASGRFVTTTVAGTPTGTPPTGTMVYDTTAHKLWVYDAGWKGVVLS